MDNNYLCADEACMICGELGAAEDFNIFTQPVDGLRPRRVYCKNVEDCALRMLRWSADLVRQDLDAALLRRGAA